MNYKFEQTLIDIIQEQQIKLGYMKETLRFYFPIESIRYLLDLEDIDDNDIIDRCLNDELARIKTNFGQISFASKANRYEITIPPEGSTFVYETIGKNPFLEELIELFNSHLVDMKKVKDLFNKYDTNYICQKEDGIDFDFLLYFSQNKKDNYFYCVKFDEGHGSYHRFNEHDIKGIIEV